MKQETKIKSIPEIMHLLKKAAKELCGSLWNGF